MQVKLLYLCQTYTKGSRNIIKDDVDEVRKQKEESNEKENSFTFSVPGLLPSF